MTELDLTTLEGNIAQMWLYATSGIFKYDEWSYASGAVQFIFDLNPYPEYSPAGIRCKILFEEDKRCVAKTVCCETNGTGPWTTEWFFDSPELRKEAILAAQGYNTHMKKLRMR